MIIPPYLKSGDTIALIAPAGKIDKNYVSSTVSRLEQEGFVVILGKSIYFNQGVFAGTDIERANDLNEFIKTPSVKAIIAIRGGYGCIRILNHVNLLELKKSPKWVCGFSDITVLHSALNKIGVASLHSTMPVNFQQNSPASLSTLFDALKGNHTSIETNSSNNNRIGETKGELVGGNISVLNSLLGTTYQQLFKNKVVFLEDLDEYLYHMDRMLQSFKASNSFEGIKGVIVGSLSGMKQGSSEFHRNAEEIILDAFEDNSIPICFNFPVGHQNDNRALILGKEISLSVQTNRVLTVQ